MKINLKLNINLRLVTLESKYKQKSYNTSKGFTIVYWKNFKY